MTIEYVVVENHLTSDPDDYMARVTAKDTVDQDAIIEDMLSQGSTLTKPDLKAALEAYNQAIAKRLLGGYRINTPTCNLSASIQGVFNGPQDNFDASRHVLNAVTNPGADLRNQMRQMGQTKKQEARPTGPNPTLYVDFGSDTTNSILSPNNPGQLTGHRLKVDPTDARQGVFFINSNDGTAIQATMLMRNKPADLMFMLPALAPGDYWLEVRVANDPAGTLYSGRLRQVLSVPS